MPNLKTHTFALSIAALFLIAAAVLVFTLTRSDKPSVNEGLKSLETGYIYPDTGKDAPGDKSAPAYKPPMPDRPSQAQRKKYPLSQLHYLNSCYNRTDCGYSGNDPKQIFLQIGRDVAYELKNLLNKWKSGDTSDFAMSDAAHTFIQIPDKQVQEAALQLFAHLPPGSEHFSALVNAIPLSKDPIIIELIMMELKRYLPLGYSEHIRNVISQTIASAPPLNAQLAAKHAIHFITEDNISYFRDLSESLPPGKVAEQLAISIQQAHRRISK